jgi:hypothetical protein
MTVISANDLAFLRADHHLSAFYLSFLKPLTLWSARVNDAEIEDAETEIVFDGGTGSHFAAIEAPQTLWVGTSPGAHDIGIIRIRAITSGDSGVTGTVTVAAQNFPWINDLYLTFIHNYQLWAVYPYIDPVTETFYKDRDIPWSSVDRPPIPILSLSMKAGFVRNGSLTFFVNASNSYPIQAGTAVASYALSCYPTSGVTVDFDTGTGLGSVKVTSLTQEYYWLKLTVNDDNGQSISTWRCVFAHNPEPGNATYPITDFTVNQVVRSIGRGGSFAQVIVRAEDLSPVPKRAFSVLWKESVYGNDMELGNFAKMVVAGNKLYVNPSIGYTFTDSTIPLCVVDFTFTASVMVDGAPAPDGTVCNLGFVASGGGLVTGSAMTAGGIISITLSTSGSVNCANGSVTFSDTDETVNLLTVPYDYRNTPVIADEQRYPSTLWVFPHHLAVGYLYRASAIADLSRGVNTTTMDIVSVEEYLRREFQFSVSLTSDDAPDVWYEFPADELSIGEALAHLYLRHSTLFQIADVAGLAQDGMDLNYATDFEEGTLYGMAEAMYNRVRRVLATDRNGNLRFVPILNLLTDAERATLDTTMTITDTDKGANLNFVQRHWKPAAFASVSGIYFDGTFDGDGNPTAEGFCAIAPGPVPEYGGEAFVRLERQTLRSQEHANELAGRLLARENREIEEVVVLFQGDYSDYLEPRDDMWAIDDDHNNLGVVWSGQRLIPDTITIQVSVEKGLVTCFAFFEPEVVSRTGVSTECLSFPIDPGGEPDDVPNPIPTPGGGFGTNYVLVDGVLGRTRDLSASSPSWSDITGGITGTLYDFVLDPWNPFQIGYVSSTTGFWKSVDLDQTVPTWTQILSKSEIETGYSSIKPGNDYINGRKIMASINREGWVAFIHQKGDIGDGDRMALLCTITTDGGSSWSYNVIADGSVNTTQIRPFLGGADYLPHLVGDQVVMGVACKSQQGNGRFYYTTDSGVTWTLVDIGNFGSGGNDGGIVVHYPYNNNSTGQIIYAVWQNEGLYRSEDGGSNWSELGSDIYTNAKRHGIESYTENRMRLFHWREDDTLWLSTDGGDSWSQANATGVSGMVRAAGGFPYNNQQYYVLTTTGIFVSIDNGDTFTDKTGDWAFGFTITLGNSVITPLWLEE